jgi:hypothetical protein
VRSSGLSGAPGPTESTPAPGGARFRATDRAVCQRSGIHPEARATSSAYAVGPQRTSGNAPRSCNARPRYGPSSSAAIQSALAGCEIVIRRANELPYLNQMRTEHCNELSAWWQNDPPGGSERDVAQYCFATASVAGVARPELPGAQVVRVAANDALALRQPIAGPEDGRRSASESSSTRILSTSTSRRPASRNRYSQSKA